MNPIVLITIIFATGAVFVSIIYLGNLVAKTPKIFNYGRNRRFFK